MNRCEEKTKSGKRCKNSVSNGKFCHVHQPKIIIVKRLPCGCYGDKCDQDYGIGIGMGNMSDFSDYEK